MSERIKDVHYDKNKDEPSSVHVVQPDGAWLDVSGFAGNPEIMGDERFPYRLVYSYEEANAMIDTGLQTVNAFKGVRSMMKTKRQLITKQGDSHEN